MFLRELKNYDYIKKYKNLFISFSGGKTSAYMTKFLIDNFSKDFNIKVVFANTGQEHEETYKFIDRCDKEFGFNVTWIEAVVHHNKKKSNGWRVVDFDTATRDGSLFLEDCKKYGLMNHAFPHCTRDLKTAPMHNFIKDNGWKHGDYLCAVGIRADEIDRINPNYKSRHYWYPLADLGITKKDVNDFFLKQNFNLNIPDYLGNCTWCWKKTLRKHMTLIDECPEIYEVPRMLEKKFKKFYRNDKLFEGEVLFRSKRSTQDLFDLHAKGGFDKWVDEYFNDCGETCEAMGTEKSEAVEDEVLNQMDKEA